MTSVYQTEIYPKLPSAPEDEGQSYRLQKIGEAEKFLRDEVAYRNATSKRFKRRATAMTITDTSVITGITALEIGSVIALTTGVGFPVSIILAATGLLLGLGAAAAHKTKNIFESKTKKHDKIKILAEAKLDSISSLISKAVKDARISHEEFQFILFEIENYRRLKQEIRSKSKQVINTITAEQRELILAQGRQEGKADFLAKIAASSGIQTVNAT